MKFRGEIEICGHKSPYKRIDVRYPGRKRVITRQELMESGTKTEPDLEIYTHSYINDTWTLKEGA